MNWDDLSKDKLLSRFLKVEERIDELEMKLEQKGERIKKQQERIEELERRLRKYENPYTPPSMRSSLAENPVAIC
jgi:transposase